VPAKRTVKFKVGRLMRLAVEQDDAAIEELKPRFNELKSAAEDDHHSPVVTANGSARATSVARA